MIRPLLALLVATVALWTWNASLETSADARRTERNRVARLLTDDERDALQIAAVIVEARGSSWLYGSVRGEWRCLDLHQAPVDRAALQSLVDKLTRAEGLRRSEDPNEAASFGIATTDGVRVAFAGPRVLDDPGRDVQIAFDIGYSVTGREAAFVRILGRRAVWEIDSDPRVELEFTDDRPPLLAKGVVPAHWAGFEGGLARLFVDRPDGGYELAKRRLDVTPEQLRQGSRPWTWIVDPGENESEANVRAQALSLFVQRLPYRTVLDPARRAEFELGRPRATVTLVGTKEASLQLVLGANAGGEFAVWNTDTACLYALSAEVADLLVPDRSDFALEDTENPYDAYLRASGPRNF